MDKRHKRGYTLVEILIGVFIMSIGIVSILGAFPLGMRIVFKIKRTTVLCNFAVSKLAEYQAYANPSDTLCAGEATNPFAFIPVDQLHTTPGIARDDAGETGLVNGVPGGGDNGGLEIRGAGRNLHWKVTDFEYFTKNQPVLYQLERAETDYGDITSENYRMGLTQNNRRYEEAYGFTRKYIIEVWGGGALTKTDPLYNPATDELTAYYAFSTAVWDPHIVHTTEWAPVMETTIYATPNCEGNHDYYWYMNNRLEGWGFRSTSAKDVTQDMALPYPAGYPVSPLGGEDPWL